MQLLAQRSLKHHAYLKAVPVVVVPARHHLERVVAPVLTVVLIQRKKVSSAFL